MAEFKDTWTLNDIDLAWKEEIQARNPGVHLVIEASRHTANNSMMSYLTYMAVRLIELHRVLKETGSIYLHCDPTAGHYLKLIMDAVFGRKQFRNEVVWCYRRWPSKQRNFQRMHDTILRYSVSDEYAWNQQHEPLSESTLKQWGETRQDAVFEDGKRKRSSKTETISDGAPMRDVWDLPVIAPRAKERCGYPTQKPLALLERIIKASSNPGDLVLDPFCGCATTLVAAQDEGRKWIGIDISEVAVSMIKKRFKKELNLIKPKIHERKDLPVWSGAKRSQGIMNALWSLQDGKCNLCGHDFPKRNMTIDHITPRVHGGPDVDENLQLLCNACNSSKGTRSMETVIAEFRSDKTKDLNENPKYVRDLSDKERMNHNIPGKGHYQFPVASQEELALE